MQQEGRLTRRSDRAQQQHGIGDDVDDHLAHTLAEFAIVIDLGDEVALAEARHDHTQRNRNPGWSYDQRHNHKRPATPQPERIDTKGHQGKPGLGFGTHHQQQHRQVRPELITSQKQQRTDRKRDHKGAQLELIHIDMLRGRMQQIQQRQHQRLP